MRWTVFMAVAASVLVVLVVGEVRLSMAVAMPLLVRRRALMVEV